MNGGKLSVPAFFAGKVGDYAVLRSGRIVLALRLRDEARAREGERRRRRAALLRESGRLENFRRR